VLEGCDREHRAGVYVGPDADNSATCITCTMHLLPRNPRAATALLAGCIAPTWHALSQSCSHAGPLLQEDSDLYNCSMSCKVHQGSWSLWHWCMIMGSCVLTLSPPSAHSCCSAACRVQHNPTPPCLKLPGCRLHTAAGCTEPCSAVADVLYNCSVRASEAAEAADNTTYVRPGCLGSSRQPPPRRKPP
jgi:hypothetical protein